MIPRGMRILAFVALLFPLASPTAMAATLRALFVDLEFEPAPEEGGRAIEQAMNDAATADPRLEGTRVRFDGVHFAKLTPGSLRPGRYDFIVLSPQGTPWSRYETEQPSELRNAKKLLEGAIRQGTPLLGVCGGHQLLALIYGGDTDMMDPHYRGSDLESYPADAIAETGEVEITATAPDPLLEGVPSPEGRFRVTEIHREEVSKFQEPLENLARSRMCRNQILHVKGRIAYGVQFHPEYDTSEGAGRRILTNFLRMVVASKNARP